MFSGRSEISVGNQLSRCFYFMVRCYKIHPIGFEVLAPHFRARFLESPALAKNAKGWATGGSRRRRTRDAVPGPRGSGRVGQSTLHGLGSADRGVSFSASGRSSGCRAGIAIHDSGPPWESRFQRACGWALLTRNSPLNSWSAPSFPRDRLRSCRTATLRCRLPVLAVVTHHDDDAIFPHDSRSPNFCSLRNAGRHW